MNRRRKIQQLAQQCADEAASVAAPGQLKVADPMPGDWDALHRELGEVSDEDRQIFQQSYRRRLEQHTGDRM